MRSLSAGFAIDMEVGHARLVKRGITLRTNRQRDCNCSHRDETSGTRLERTEIVTPRRGTYQPGPSTRGQFDRGYFETNYPPASAFPF